ncbi:MAG: ribonuclease HII [Candidatus Paceibacterota bacterium]
MGNLETTKYIIGIDEVGRGPLAGPVAVCAFLIKDDSFVDEQFPIGQTYGKLPKLKDSKKLSKKQREEWFQYLKEARASGFCDYVVSFVSPENIDKFGIAKCIQKALNESLKKVTSSGIANSRVFTPEGPYADENLQFPTSFPIFLDGGLHAPAEYINQETIIRGDELHPVISLASIVAKVSRDAVMTKYGKVYPEYGFEKHSGYGTRAHYAAIKKHGQTPIHRKSFIH